MKQRREGYQNRGFKVWERKGDLVRLMAAWDEGGSICIDIISAHRAVFKRALYELAEIKMPSCYACPLSLGFFKQALELVEAEYGEGRRFYCEATDERRARVYEAALRRFGYKVERQDHCIIRWSK